MLHFTGLFIEKLKDFLKITLIKGILYVVLAIICFYIYKEKLVDVFLIIGIIHFAASIVALCILKFSFIRYLDNRIVIDYTNWRGERGKRDILVSTLYFGKNKWHPTYRWLVKAYDYDKEELRDFSLRDIHSIKIKETHL